jgi:flagellar basal body rod protein FlgG
VKQGLLCTKGKILGLYNNEGMFYLEKSRQIMTETGNEIVDGPYIKYGPKKKSIQFSLDLTPYNPKMPLTILKVAGSKNKFQIFEGE